MLPLIELSTILAISLNGAYATIGVLVQKYGYLAIFILMTLESASLPIPSEVVLPTVGRFIHSGHLDPYISLLVVLLASIFGMLVDYYIAYLLGKKFIYRLLSRFHIKEESMKLFESWFNNNGAFAVFIARLLPEVRGLISFPAGIARMHIWKFLFFSFIGAFIWDVALISFGYYALSTHSLVISITAIALFIILLYIIYRIAIGKMKHKSKKRKR